MPDPMKCETLTAYLSVDEDGNEGVIGQTIPGLGFTPFIGADHEFIKSLRPLAVAIGKAANVRITVAQFSVRTDWEEILP